ncbi:MAG: hypothetical protein ABI678_14650 [Kofleriaceae bacterium]
MAIRSPPRLDWAPGDSSLVSYRNRLVQLHDAQGVAKRELASERIYDVRWRDDGMIVVLDDRGSLTFDRSGALVQQTHFRIDVVRAPMAASMSANGDRYVAIGEREIFAVQLEGGERPERIWTLHAASYGVGLGDRGGGRTESTRVGIEMSPDGRLVAIGYPGSGRAWIVIELATDQFLQRSALKSEAPGSKAATPQLFAFDHAGTRLAHAIPDPGTSWGVTRLEVEDRQLVRTVPGAARAVALDRGGLLAAYAYAKPPTGERGRLRIDYLSPAPDGPATVETLDTLSIDPELPDIVALAFSRDSRQLACLASTGAIEIVPTP